ncbi:ABC transporter ATP-binding protein [Paenibacillus filicis]|uniref:ABC transporter ATP-binding protein n=1 Tax=Paenibacillus gyeongsangnamensis TaxID=3388067 RepID=A0ABT4QBG7_9BACL|nr:ABC transporter ATP-binding protein [Paenibacillus filicis]MCZ8514211.1 ABC transporter ATP-binding protein [Paenibacillus filicis]
MKEQRLLADYLRSNWIFYVFAILSTTVANIVQSYYPKVLGSFTDTLQGGRITEAVIADYAFILLSIGVAYGILGGLGQYTVMRLGRKFEFSTRRKLFRHFTALSESYYSKHGIGELLSYVMNDVTSVRESISQGINQTTNAVILILSAIVMMSLSSIPLYLIGICILPLLTIPWIVVIFGPKIRSRSRKVQESLAKMTESAEEQFGGIRVTKKFAVEPIMRARFGETVDRIRDNQLRLVRLSSLFQAILPFMGALSLIITIAFGGYLTIRGSITLGNFVSLTLYLRMIVNPLQQIGNVINTMQRSRASLERVNSLLCVRPDIVEAEQAGPLHRPEGGIRIEGLTFAYPDSSKPALQDISLNVAPGKTLGIIGKTGSGKTTLVKLLLRIYDPPAGTVWVGGEDIREVSLESLRNHIAYVPQDGFLFSTTIRDNIAFSNRDLELAPVEKAAKQAQIYENILGFPDRFETKLGERGITLSGGQRQRTSLARGFIKNAPLLILDDSVSAVDAVTETKIIENLRLGRKDKTTIIIAHRISALKHADEIIVLDEGRIVQRGTHRQLLSDKEGIYAALYAIQEEGTRYAEGK